jgi:hypothetical protein
LSVVWRNDRYISSKVGGSRSQLSGISAYATDERQIFARQYQNPGRHSTSRQALLLTMHERSETFNALLPIVQKKSSETWATASNPNFPTSKYHRIGPS